MTRTTARTLELLGLLQTYREWTGTQLCDRLEVSPRTLRRDIDDLRGLGYGIESVPGVGGGYRLGVGASIPPLVLSVDEAVAIAVGLRAAATGAVTGVEDASARALAKLEQSLSSSTREHISAIEHAIVPLGTPADRIDMNTVVAVAQAIRATRRLRIDYRRHDGVEVRRTVEPHRIVHTTDRWYLVAWDADHEAWRTLRLDRLTPRLPLAETFRPRDIPDDELLAFTSRSISIAPYRYRCRLLMAAPAAEVEQHFGPAVAVVTDLGDGTSELQTGAHSLEHLVLYIGTSGIDFTVIEGEGLRGALSALATRLQRAALA